MSGDKVDRKIFSKVVTAKQTLMSLFAGLHVERKQNKTFIVCEGWYPVLWTELFITELRSRFVKIPRLKNGQGKRRSFLWKTVWLKSANSQPSIISKNKPCNKAIHNPDERGWSSRSSEAKTL